MNKKRRVEVMVALIPGSGDECTSIWVSAGAGGFATATKRQYLAALQRLNAPAGDVGLRLAPTNGPLGFDEVTVFDGPRAWASIS